MHVSADLRYALRVLRKSPVFAAAAVGTLALGIGVNASIFALVKSVLLQPLPYAAPDRVVMVWEDASRIGFPKNTPAPANYLDWRRLNRSFVDMAATRAATGSVVGDGPPEQLLGRAVTHNFFSVLGVRPVVGRMFAESDDATGAQVVVISYGLWQRRYGGDPGIASRRMLLNGARYDVIGVAPRSFAFRDRDIDYWIPLQFGPEQANVRGSHFLNVVARLRPSVTIAMAQLEMEAIARQLAQQFPATNRQLGVRVVPIDQEVLGDTTTEVVVLMIAAACILLIVCANLSTLFLSRAAARHGEYGVRVALGASRRALVRSVVVEALVLAAAGGGLGLLLASGAWSLLERLVPAGIVVQAPASTDWKTIAFTLTLSIATALMFSVGPALQTTRESIALVLQQHARGAVGRSSLRTRDLLIVFQVTATLVLLIAAGLMLRTLANLDALDVGFSADHLLTMQVALSPVKYTDDRVRLSMYERVLTGVAALRGVTHVAFGSTLPFQSIGNTRWFAVDGRAEVPGETRDALFRVGTADYLQTLGVKLAAGRLLDDRDGPSAPKAVVINETLASRYVDGPSPLGRRIEFDPAGPWFTIVGVVHDVVERGYNQEPKPGVYVAAAQSGGPVPNLVVRVDGDPRAYASAVRRVIAAMDPEQPVRLIRTMNEVMRLTRAGREEHTVVLVSFGALALVIAALGLYGVLAQSVTSRSREIGLRVALGAPALSVVTLVVWRGVVLTAIGIAAGLLIGWGVTQGMTALLYGVTPADPVTFGVVASMIALVAGGACAIPAARAVRLDPAKVLRQD